MLLDTSGIFSLLVREDANHELAIELYEQAVGPRLTHGGVLLEILPLVISMPFDGVGTPRILRTLHGTARPGERASYIEEARNGTIADIDAGGGPLALHLAIGPNDDDFVTMSVWESWSALETATGGDVKRPVATRHPERIARWDAAHFEIIDG